MHMSAVQPGQLTVEEIRAKYPVADAPNGGVMLMPHVEPDRIFIEEPIKWQVPLDSPASVTPPSEWHAPLLYPDTSVSAPVNRQAIATFTEVRVIPPWVWVAATVGLLGLLIWSRR